MKLLFTVRLQVYGIYKNISRNIKEVLNGSLWVWGRQGNLIQHSKCAHVPVPQVGVRNLRKVWLHGE